MIEYYRILRKINEYFENIRTLFDHYSISDVEVFDIRTKRIVRIFVFFEYRILRYQPISNTSKNRILRISNTSIFEKTEYSKCSFRTIEASTPLVRCTPAEKAILCAAGMISFKSDDKKFRTCEFPNVCKDLDVN